ncbi:MAG: membrane protein insertion efficiency factor YidD [Helicobacteraceae bacterium]|jgi:putative membrane protein insertion efficiency factor|nr:membrane protein insertion efficiency factor YidD [Helicobacteraceae bacterium]
MRTPLLNRPFWLLVRLYQIVFSPLFGRCCRFYPSCSNYALQTLEKRALPIALAQIALRVARCNPLFKGGFDYPSMPRDRKEERKLLFFANRALKSRKIAWFIVIEGNRRVLLKRLKR